MSGRRGLAPFLGGALAAAVFVVVLPTPARAAVVRLINRDGPGEGFNDPTPVDPVGGNPGTTLGEQRLIAFQYAIDKWSTLLQSPVEIRVSAQFNALDCDANLVTLGSAAPVSVFSDFAGAPAPNTFYAAPLADRLAGVDLAPDEDDIDAEFNSVFGAGCAFPAGWYYGLDGAVPGDDSDLVTVVLHELGHGMGFLTLIDVTTGQKFDGQDDVFMQFLTDDRTGKLFTEMSNSERRNASVATGHLKWTGGEVVAASNNRLSAGADTSGRVEMYAPSQAIDGSSVSHWSDDLAPDELMEPYFTQPIHDVGLAAQALADMGWNVAGSVACPADCNNDGQVSIEELIVAVQIALNDLPLSSCGEIDADRSGNVGVNELVAAVSRALDGCAVPIGAP